MSLVCNIDQRGRKFRYRVGHVLVLLGLLVWLVSWRFRDGALPWVLGGALVAGGLFSWFEASRGWCAVRALGIKTRV